jgi:histidine triad (HIT) family protein
MKLLKIALLMVNVAHPITFSSSAELEKALQPITLAEIQERAAKVPTQPLDFAYDPDLVQKPIPLRNRGIENLLEHELYKTDQVTVFYPKVPRVPHHLAIALNRPDVQGISTVTPEENQALFAAAKKVAEIYKTVGIKGFVLAQFDRPQQGHSNRFCVEIIPHLPGFSEIKNIVDKVDSNRHVLFRTANLSAIYSPPDEIDKNIAFWQSAFQQPQMALTAKDTKISFPHTRKESHQSEADQILFHQLMELLQDQGGHPAESSVIPVMPTEISGPVKSIQVDTCLFCKPEVIARQLVYETDDIAVFYNMRKNPKPGCCFLILPKRHCEKIYDLTEEEIGHIAQVRRALVEVLKESRPDHEVIIYIQDDPATGQTVFHSHEQVIAIDPKTIGLTWTLLALYPSGNVSDEEMQKVSQEFRLKLEQKMKQAADLAQAS